MMHTLCYMAELPYHVPYLHILLKYVLYSIPWYYQDDKEESTWNMIGIKVVIFFTDIFSTGKIINLIESMQ